MALKNPGFAHAIEVELSPFQMRSVKSHCCHSMQQGVGENTLAHLADFSLGLVVCFEVFEHLPPDICARWFAQIHLVSRPGGRLIGHVPNGLSPFAGQV